MFVQSGELVVIITLLAINTFISVWSVIAFYKFRCDLRNS